MRIISNERQAEVGPTVSLIGALTAGAWMDAQHIDIYSAMS